MGLAELSLELEYMVEILRSIGHEFAFELPDAEVADEEAFQKYHKANTIVHESVDVETDSQSAHET